jgi:hypothetical protein
MFSALNNIELISGALSFLFTLLILSYVIGDNPAFRTAVHAFVGVSTGYIAISVFRLVILDKLFLPMLNGTMGERIFLAFPLVLGFFLMGKMISGAERFGRPVVAFLVGVGTAAAIGGAVLGTVFPQVLATGSMFDFRSNGNPALNLVTGVVALVGTIATLAYFQFTVIGKNVSTGKRGLFLDFLALLGQVFIVIALGAIFAGVLAASLTAFVDRVQSVIKFFADLFF